MSLSDFLFEKTPWWIAIVILFFFCMIKYGPSFLREWNKTIHDIKKKGLNSEYITELKMQRDRLQKELDELKAEIKSKKQ